MRKIEQQMVKAIEELKPFHKDNTRVDIYKNQFGPGLHRIEVYLHDNLIMTHNFCDAHVTFSQAGWDSPTTCSRLNALSQHYIGNRPFHIKEGTLRHSGETVWNETVTRRPILNNQRRLSHIEWTVTI